MSLFHETLKDAKSKIDEGDTEEAKRILNDHLSKHLDEEEGLLVTLANKIEIYKECIETSLNFMLDSDYAKETVTSKIDEALDTLHEIERKIKDIGPFLKTEE